MKIVRIFADQLFAFHYDKEAENEYERLMVLWTNVAYLFDYAKKNKVSDVMTFIEGLLKDAEQIQDYLENLKLSRQTYGLYFEPLQDSEKTRVLSLRKGKMWQNQLRFYAIKIDDDCFIITGGAIKMSQKMLDHMDTATELKKLQAARAYLNENGVFDQDSFFELLYEPK